MVHQLDIGLHKTPGHKQLLYCLPLADAVSHPDGQLHLTVLSWQKLTLSWCFSIVLCSCYMIYIIVHYYIYAVNISSFSICPSLSETHKVMLANHSA